MNKYLRFALFFFKQFPQWLFSRGEYHIGYDGQQLVFGPRSADPFTFYEVYLDEQYDTRSSPSKKVVVDIGANVGLFSLWATKKYNPRQIIAVEMDSNNCKYLRSAVKANDIKDCVTTINKAFFSKSTKLGEIVFPSLFSSCYRLDENVDGDIETITLKEILDQVKGKTVDLMKLDIEGSEKYLFSKENSKLLKEKVKVIVVEVHPQFGTTVTQTMNFLADSGYKVVHMTYMNLGSESLRCHVVTGLRD